MIKFFIVLGMLLSLEASPALAAPRNCDTVVSIKELRGVLYKPENLHGARGPTFLVQNAYERTRTRRLQIRDVNCNLISHFGLFSTDWPYGARYYQRSGGSSHTARQLVKLARRAGSPNILVQGARGKWIRVTNPMRREGTIYSE